MRSARVVQKRPAERLPPVIEHRYERAALDSRAQEFIERIDNAQSFNRSVPLQFDQLCDQRPVRFDPHDVVTLLEFPCCKHAAVEAVSDTRVVHQFARVLRYATSREV
jgi:hypothetical protein